MSGMMDYYMETGACIMVFLMDLMLAGIVTAGIVYDGIWPLAFLYPPLGFVTFGGIYLWKNRPSVKRF